MPEMNLQFDARHSATVTYTAPVAKYRFVSWAGAHATDAAAVQGISELAGPAGRAGSLVTSYSYVVEAAAAIPAGSSVAPSSDGTGRAVVAGGGGCGRAITAAAAAGDLVTVVLQLGGGALVSGEGVSERPSSYARVVAALTAPMSSGTGDLSGSGAVIGPPSTYAAAYSTNAGWFTSNNGQTAGVGNSEYAILPNRYLNGLTIGRDSWWISFEMLMPVLEPSANISFFGFADTTTRFGLYLQARYNASAPLNGKIRPFLNTPAGYQAGLADSTVVVADGTAKRLDIAMDRTGMLFLLINGEPVDQWQCGHLISEAMVTANMAFGRNIDTGTAATGVLCRFRNVHVYTFPNKNLPLNMAALAKRIMARPLVPLSDAEILGMSAPIVAYTQAGQSWDQGSGPTPNKVLRLGPPMADGIPPFGPAGSGSPHPAMIDEAGRLGAYMVVANTARGGSSIANHWCGRLLAWASAAGARVAFGQYVIATGGIYKATAVPSSTNGTAGATEPNGASYSQNSVTWTRIRDVTAADTPGKIMSPSDDLWDPNGYIANLVLYNGRFLNAARRHVDITFGQEDSTRQTSRSDYALAHRYITQYLLDRGYTVTIGISAYVAAGDAWYTSDLIPGMTDALAHFAGNSAVQPGVNVRSLLGVMSADANQRPGVLTLRADELHGNDECQLLIGKARAPLVLA